MKNKRKDIIIALVGIVMIAIGLFLVKTTGGISDAVPALQYVLIGIGCGLFGHGLGDYISQKAMASSPETAKKMEIEKNDERNIAIENAAKAKAYNMMTFVYGAMMIALALMGTSVPVVLLVVATYLFVQFYSIYCRTKLEKEM